ncbi:selenoprotein W, 1 [Polyodon spathula]|uniref:selenoprotein W, 1 n=1 Tax=Polyodon spathula TaxID=7913 RepID=UPI001B7DA779|nr:selenoprotein W, 1 [Polyodon spathula]
MPVVESGVVYFHPGLCFGCGADFQHRTPVRRHASERVLGCSVGGCEFKLNSSVLFVFVFQFNHLKLQLEDEFPGDVDITGEGTRQSTGWFEVTINGRLVHSKKGGDGFVDSDQKMQKIMKSIEEAMKR